MGANNVGWHIPSNIGKMLFALVKLCKSLCVQLPIRFLHSWLYLQVTDFMYVSMYCMYLCITIIVMIIYRKENLLTGSESTSGL